jgi:hypothetical protein
VVRRRKAVGDLYGPARAMASPSPPRRVSATLKTRLLKKKRSATASSAALRWRVEQDW